MLWGDWIKVVENESDGIVKVRARGSDGWVPSKNLQRERLLEIVFVDIGQGDGALVVTPQDEALVIDAGEGDSMYRFLRWRFGRFERPFRFKAGVVTHPDLDHCKAFGPLLKEPNIQFEALYHNGIMEDTSSDGLGAHSAINLRSDGEKALLAYKLEVSRVIGQSVSNWDIYQMEPDASGQLAYVRPDQPVRRQPRDQDESD